MFGLWRSYRGRRAAAGQIIPLLEGTRRRLGGIPGSAWRDPYVVGFLGMLITMVATRVAGALGTNDLAAVQAKAWADITGASGDVFGEEICFYDAAHDDRFISGCRNAEAFYYALNMVRENGDQGLGPGAPTPFLSQAGDGGSALWSRYFDAHLGGPAIGPEP